MPSVPHPAVVMPDDGRVQVRDRILDAGAALAVELGWSKVRMSTVAARSGVSRQTVYDHFATKDGLALGILTVEVQRVLGLMRAELDAHDDPRTAIRRAAGAVLEDSRGNALLRVVLDGGPDGDPELLRMLTSDAAPVHAAIWEAIAPWGARTFPDVHLARLVGVVDVVGRVVVSHLVQPGPEGLDVPRTLADMVVAYLEA